MDIAQVANMLRAVLAEIDGNTGTNPPAVAPPGFVYVSPTGPRGAGKSRLWPEPHPEQGEMLLGYAGRCMNVLDATGRPYYAAGRYGPILQAHGQFDNCSMAEALDRITYPFDWMTQEQLDRDAALTAQDGGNAGGGEFSPG